jgi:acetyl-CoA carboxylase carboxyltransferase component
MTWQPELDELHRREELARQMGGPERVGRQHAAGKLTVRERVERLLDRGSFHETGTLAGKGDYDAEGGLTGFLPANAVVGQGRIDGRRAMVQADDFTVRGGAADAAIWQKMVWAERAAHELRVPLVRLVDGTGGGGSVKTLETMGFSYVPPLPGFDEVGARYGRSLMTGLARLDGRPVGVLASDPNHYAGGLTADASDKLARFVDMCDAFRLPVVNFVDQPGFVIGTEAERAGTIRRGARALTAVHQAHTPWCSVLVRKVYGVAGAGHGDGSRLNLRFAWPSGAWGSLPIEGGIEAAYRRELEAAEDPVALRAAIETRLNAVRSPFRTAERFSVEEIIDPRDTRPLLCDWAARAHELVALEAGRGPVARGTRP